MRLRFKSRSKASSDILMSAYKVRLLDVLVVSLKPASYNEGRKEFEAFYNDHVSNRALHHHWPTHSGGDGHNNDNNDINLYTTETTKLTSL